MEGWYRWIGWASGLVFLAFSRAAPNLWLGLAVGLFGGCQIGHWAVERLEAARGRKLLVARYAEAVLLFVACPAL
jgi:hypothetical protein